MPRQDTDSLVTEYFRAKRELGFRRLLPGERARRDAKALKRLDGILKISERPVLLRRQRNELRRQTAEVAGQAGWVDPRVNIEILRIDQALTRKKDPSLATAMHQAYLADRGRTDTYRLTLPDADPPAEQPVFGGMTKQALMSRLLDAALLGARSANLDPTLGTAAPIGAELRAARREAEALARNTTGESLGAEEQVTALERSTYLRTRWERFDAIELPHHLNQVDDSLRDTTSPYPLPPSSALAEQITDQAPADKDASPDIGPAFEARQEVLQFGVPGLDAASTKERERRARLALEHDPGGSLEGEAKLLVSVSGDLSKALAGDPILRDIAAETYGALSDFWMLEHLEQLQARQSAADAFTARAGRPLALGTAPTGAPDPLVATSPAPRPRGNPAGAFSPSRGVRPYRSSTPSSPQKPDLSREPGLGL